MKVRKLLLLPKRPVYRHVIFSNWRQADDFRDMSMGYRTPVMTTIMKLGFRKEVNRIRNPGTSMSFCQGTKGTEVNRA